MKVKVEIVDNLEDVEVIIRSSIYDTNIENLKKIISSYNTKNREIIFYKNETEYFLPIDSILFFEMDGAIVYAHDKEDCYTVNFKLYELEEITPNYFLRISKGGIVNVREIYSLEKSFSGTRTARFRNSLKKIHISRKYYKQLKEKLMKER